MGGYRCSGTAATRLSGPSWAARYGRPPRAGAHDGGSGADARAGRGGGVRPRVLGCPAGRAVGSRRLARRGLRSRAALWAGVDAGRRRLGIGWVGVDGLGHVVSLGARLGPADLAPATAPARRWGTLRLRAASDLH